MTVTVRPARPSDVDAVLPMILEVERQHRALDAVRFDYEPDANAMYRGWLVEQCASDEGCLFVAEHAGGALVGFCVATVVANVPVYRTKRYGFVHDIYVAPAHRGAGVGGRLLDATVERLRAQGATQVRLETAAANEPARRAFAKRGFRVSVIEMIRGSE